MTQVQNEKKCDCLEFYSNELFDNKCSNCFYKINPEKYLEIMKTNPITYHTDSYLYKYVFEKKIPTNNIYFKTLSDMFSNGSILDFNNYSMWINHIKSNNYLGISVSQGIKIINNYKKMNGEINLDLIQHLVCSIIIDWWNLAKNKHIFGSVCCYYFNDSDNSERNVNSLRYGINIALPPAISDIEFLKKAIFKL